jgi:hypothetical protein
LYVILIAVILRLGVLALATLWFTDILLGASITFDISAWYSGSSLIYFAVLMGLLIYGFVASGGGQTLEWVGHVTDETDAKVEAATS